MHKRFTLQLLAASAALALCGTAAAQSSIKIASIVELSGGGATAGTNFKNGVELAVKEINAAGGFLGKKIESASNDTQSNPGVAKGLTQKAVDNEVFAIFGPVFSGSIMVSMAESRRAEVPNWTGGEAAAITQHLEAGRAGRLDLHVGEHRRSGVQGDIGRLPCQIDGLTRTIVLREKCSCFRNDAHAPSLSHTAR